MSTNPFLEQQRQQIREQFSLSRRAIEGQKRKTEDQLKQQLARFGATSGVGTGSGAIQRAQQRALTEAGQRFGEVDAQVGAQELEALRGLSESERGREFATSERLGSQQFATGERLGTQKFATGERVGSQQFASAEAAKARELQESQFARSLGLSERQLDLAFQEFAESVKANFINSAIALKDAKLTRPQDWQNLLGRVYEDGSFTMGPLQFLFPERDLPNVQIGGRPNVGQGSVGPYSSGVPFQGFVNR